MEPYHFRRNELMLSDPATLAEIIAGQRYMTLAMCREDRPYLVTVNYAYDKERSCFYFHCAGHGKKIDYLRANPAVWGQILEDRGYMAGRCDHAYRSVQFEGQVDFLDDPAEKRHALDLMIDFLEPDPAPVKARLLVEPRIAGVTIGRVIVQHMTAKQDHITNKEI